MVENRGPELRAVCATFVSMAFVSTALRIYTRLRIVKAFGWDDAWMVFALLSHIMFATCAIAGIHYGTGRHMKDLSPDGIFKALRYWWLCYIAYCWAMIGAKISIGLFLLRITVKRMHRWIIYIVMMLTVITGFVFFFVTLFQCSPIDYFWDRNQKGFCINIDIIIGLTFLYGAISAVCDFTFGLLPVVLVWNLNMKRSSKILLIPILSMACVASTAVLVRMAYIMKFRTNDFLYDTVDIAIWSDTEQGLAITAGSLATLRPLYRVVAGRLGLSTDPSEKTPGTSGKMPSGGWYRSGQEERSKRSQRSGPFSLTTLLRTERDRDTDEDYGMGDLQPVRLRDDLIEETPSQKSEKGFGAWRIQVGEGSSEEDLNNKSSRGITRQTDVYLESATRGSH